MSVKDFSLAMYEGLCQALQKHNPVTVQEYLLKSARPSGCVVMRHDVDRSVKSALAMAALEHRYCIRSTYYFRYPATFRPDVMKKIHNLGHEIGYHYEVLDKAKGDFSKAISLFQKELQEFRKLFPVKTICMHGNPLTKWDGRDLWKSCDYRDYGILGEAYLSLTDISAYLTDTGRNWNGNNNVKDRMKTEEKSRSFQNTEDVIQYIRSSSSQVLYLNCHPERWPEHFAGWLITALRDHFFNLCKQGLRWLHLR